VLPYPSVFAARLALVAIFLSGQLGGLIHQATVVHVRCPEDGELVDSHRVAARGPARSAGLAAWAEAHARGQGAPDEARGLPDAPGHHHDHCAIACASHERATVRAALLAVAAIDPASRRSAVPAAAGIASRLTVYRVAPKTSPPA